MVTAYKLIHAQQQDWASQQGIKFNKDGYTLSLNNNLFLPLSARTKAEFESGKGDELGSEGKRGKMQALHSSSALVINVFEYWRNHNVNSIAKACGAPEGMTKMRFEQIYPTPLGGIPPHLDIELYVVSESGTKWAFEVTDTLEATTLLPGDSIIVLSFC